jgi:nitroreductase
MLYSKPVTKIIEQRYSCRSYLNKPIEQEKRQKLEHFLSASQTGPFGTRARFELVAATEQDRNALRGLGTYGFIRGATGFIVGAVDHSERDLEDYGYLMEQIILRATDLELGTCWLGGSFQKSNFAKKISVGDEEQVPAVSSVGYIADRRHVLDRMIRRRGRFSTRRPWETMFFDKAFGRPLPTQAAGAYAVPLEMARLGPSASNKQPWRIIKDGNTWHFYLQRTEGYGNGRLVGLLDIADVQRIDMGIAMSHFELAAKEASLRGEWKINEPDIEKPDELTEYTASWRSRNGR